MKTIQVTFKNVYGNEIVYPVSESAKLFARIAGTKTLTSETLTLIKLLGYTIEVVTDQPKTI